jgi:hypothetical protein
VGKPQEHLEAAIRLARKLPRGPDGKLTPAGLKAVEHALQGAFAAGVPGGAVPPAACRR